MTPQLHHAPHSHITREAPSSKRASRSLIIAGDTTPPDGVSLRDLHYGHVTMGSVRLHLWNAVEDEKEHIRASKPLQKGQEHRAPCETCHKLPNLSHWMENFV